MMNKFNGLSHNLPPELREKKGLIDEEALMSFGNFLKEARLALKEKSLSKKEVKAADIRKKLNLQASSSVINWENGETFPSDKILEEVANAYGVSLDTLREKLQISKDAREVIKSNRIQKSGPSRNPFDDKSKSGFFGYKSPTS